MSEVSEVSEELRVYAVRERKCWTETEILHVLKEIEDYALDSPLPLFSAYDKLAENSGQPWKLGSAFATYLSK